jgi:trehalose-phosphatase
MSPPCHVFDCWENLEARIRRARHVAVFTDFDGTLVRIQKSPGAVWLSRRMRLILAGIAGSGATVAVVSGRALADVRRRVRLGGIWYAGDHGFSLRSPGNRSLILATPTEWARIRSAIRILGRRLRGVPGIRLEPKGVSVAVHYRAASKRNREFARGVVAELAERFPGVSLLAGKQVWDLLPNSRTNKWTAISTILRRERARKPSGRWLAIYAGDDTTDELVFQRMQGVTIAVGKKHRTAARFYLRAPAEVGQFLERLREHLE